MTAYQAPTQVKSTSSAPRALSIPDAAHRWGVSADFIRKQIAVGRLRSFRCGRVIRIRIEDLDALFTPTQVVR